jgi:hypothetical protein
MSAKNIFICYRRDDAEGYAGRVYDRLNSRFPRRVFMDVTGISPGADFSRVIQDTVGSCHVLIAIIGRHWVTVKDASNRRRLDLADDYVRHEIATALQRNITVIPVLVRGAEMPSRELLPPDLAALSTRNALEITDGDFDHDAQRLIEVLENVCGEPRPFPTAPTSRGRSNCLVFAVIGILAVGAIIFVLFLLGIVLVSNQNQNSGGGSEPTPQPVYAAPTQEPASQQPAVASQFPVGSWRLHIAAFDGSEDAVDVDIRDDGTYESNRGHSGDYSYSGDTLEFQGWGTITFQSRSGNGYVGSATLNGLPFSITLVPR